eukprot:symbB.v1.2.018753.t1/scaffold1508.1/size114708/12
MEHHRVATVRINLQRCTGIPNSGHLMRISQATSTLRVVLSFSICPPGETCDKCPPGGKALQRAAAEAEPELLKDALADLHRDLEGLHRWRARLAACPELQVPSRRERQRRGLLAHADSESGKQLVEISVYLLVWGEAGNIRFMPEVVCFLTELALASEDVQMGGSVYQGNSGTTKSGLFLAKIIRPIYNVIFEEWYLRVDIDAKGKDKKVLKDKFHRFLPALTL